ncbi:se39 [Artaxa digramma nucleopolyhedrovirus]|uniref:Se39 n=1 Tax=Artaxa digramma nucleopolyhedrovirus TaxID=3070910 RepID=A0AAE6UZL9_9ABAC|nr:se39 [Euproctis digramma nucleopolyhedrovirus]QHB21700.1 se39 [Artaxa digramma nucleopolyhedrovirus]
MPNEIIKVSTHTHTHTMSPLPPPTRVTYENYYNAATDVNIVQRVINREIAGVIDKRTSALSINRLACVSAGGTAINNNHLRCPHLYEADSVFFNKTLGNGRKFAEHCLTCARLLHPFDNKRQMCVFCSKEEQQ